jgi:translation elongation factor EF-1alpha
MSIDACYSSNTHTRKGFVLAGRVEGGLVKKGDKLTIKPINLEIKVKDIIVGDKHAAVGYPGDIVDMMISIAKENDWQNVQKGCFLSSVLNPVPVCTEFLASVKVYDLKDPILIGTRINLHLCGTVEGAIVSKLLSTSKKHTKEIKKTNPRLLEGNSSAEVEITLDRESCVELFTNYESLGRFQFRSKGRTLGEGRISRILG